MFERFTDRARKVMALANQESQRRNHEYIGAEHILLALAEEGTGVAANVLRNLGADPRRLRQEIRKLVRVGPKTVTADKLPQTPRAKRVIESAIAEAHYLNHNYVGTEHLLLGLLHEHEGVAAQILTNLALTPERVRAEIIELVTVGKVVEPVVPRPRATEADEFQHHPLAKHYQAIIAALTRELDKSVRNADYEWAAELRDQLTALHQGRQNLADWLRIDPNFGLPDNE